MAEKVIGFGRRRWRNGGIALALAALLVGAVHLAGLALRDTAIGTGWLLAGLLAALALFDLRKRIPMLPLGDASAWLQVHAYGGMVAVVAFLLHSRAGLPDGPFEAALWTLFLAVAGSGLVGLTLNRVLPRRMTGHGDRLVFDRIPPARAALADEAEALAMASTGDTVSITIADYHARELRRYFSGPRNRLAHLTGYRGHLRQRLRQIDSLNRYLDESGRRTMARMAELVTAKDDLDHQHAALLAMRLWPFVHVPLSFALLAAVAVHAVLAHGFAIPHLAGTGPT